MRPGRWRCSARSTATQVRVVSVGDWARELCGGTHAQRSGQLGLVKMLGRGLDRRRRTPRRGAGRGRTPTSSWPASTPWSRQLTDALKVRPEELPDRVAALTGAAARGREGARARSGRRRCWRRAAELAASPTDVVRRRASWLIGRPTAPAPTTCAGWSLDVRGRLAGRPAGGRGRRRGRATTARWWSSPSTTRAASWGIKAGELVRVAAAGARRRRRRQGRRRPGRRHRPGRSTRRCAGSSTWSASAVTAHAREAASRRVRLGRRRRLGPGRGRGAATRTGCSPRPSRPSRADRGDLTRWPRWSPSTRPSRWWSGCPARCPGGRDRPPTRAVAYAGALAAPGAPVPVRLVDERFTTVGAQRDLRASGVDTRRGRRVIDQAAAVIILQGALDAERSSGRRARATRHGSGRRRANGEGGEQ